MLLRDCHFESSLSTFIFLVKGEISTETPELLCYNGQKEEEELLIRLKRRKLI